MDTLPIDQLPYLSTMSRLLLALAFGTFVGLEREQHGHPVGLRTFGLVAVLGCMGGLEGEAYSLASLAMVGLLVVFLNLQVLRDPTRGHELTTSAAMLVTGFGGVLCGQGHTLAPVAIAVITAALLAWKGSLHGFTAGLSEQELRSAILLAMLTFVVYPALPAGGYGPQNALVPQEAWMTVILIAGIGFVNYIFLKKYGNRGVEIAGFLGGIVNSTVTVNELVSRLRESAGALADFASRGILIATAAMVARNALLLAVLDLQVLAEAWLPFLLMAVALVAMTSFWGGRTPHATPSEGVVLMTSPFSLQAALKFGLIFLALQLVSVGAQVALGDLGVYGTAFLGGLISSASAVGAVAGLAARGSVATDVAANSAVIAAVASILVNIPLLKRSGQPDINRRLGVAMLGVAVLGGLACLA